MPGVIDNEAEMTRFGLQEACDERLFGVPGRAAPQRRRRAPVCRLGCCLILTANICQSFGECAALKFCKCAAVRTDLLPNMRCT